MFSGSQEQGRLFCKWIGRERRGKKRRGEGREEGERKRGEGERRERERGAWENEVKMLGG